MISKFSERIHNTLSKFNNGFKEEFNKLILENYFDEFLKLNNNLNDLDSYNLSTKKYNFKDNRLYNFKELVEKIDTYKLLSKKSYLRKRIIQIIDSLINLADNELKYLNKNKEIMVNNLEYVLNNASNNIVKRELSKLNEEKIIPLIRLNLEFYKEIRKKLDYLISLKEKLKSNGSKYINDNNIKDILLNVYLNIRVFEEYYFERKKLIIEKIDNINKEIEFLSRNMYKDKNNSKKKEKESNQFKFKI